MAAKLPSPPGREEGQAQRGGNKDEACTLEAERAGAATSNGGAATTTGACAYGIWEGGSSHKHWRGVDGNRRSTRKKGV